MENGVVVSIAMARGLPTSSRGRSDEKLNNRHRFALFTSSS